LDSRVQILNSETFLNNVISETDMHKHCRALNMKSTEMIKPENTCKPGHVMTYDDDDDDS
jgi:hypothetical protein